MIKKIAQKLATIFTAAVLSQAMFGEAEAAVVFSAPDSYFVMERSVMNDCVQRILQAEGEVRNAAPRNFYAKNID